jgi:hypothetical protein
VLSYMCRFVRTCVRRSVREYMRGCSCMHACVLTRMCMCSCTYMRVLSCACMRTVLRVRLCESMYLRETFRNVLTSNFSHSIPNPSISFSSFIQFSYLFIFIIISITFLKVFFSFFLFFSFFFLGCEFNEGYRAVHGVAFSHYYRRCSGYKHGYDDQHWGAGGKRARVRCVRQCIVISYSYLNVKRSLFSSLVSALLSPLLFSPHFFSLH